MHRVATLLFVIVLALPTAALRAADSPAAKPNIVVILADDMGYADAGFNGSKQMRTPNLDKLAKSGAVLSSYYVQPVCSPTRASLLTGRYVTHTGVYSVIKPNAKRGLPLAERTLADALREAGYETAICGKWHLGEFEAAYRPTHRGFDHQYGLWFGAIDYFTHNREGHLDWHRNDEPSNDSGYSTHLIAKEACAVIRNQQADKPLFLYVPFNAVHAPHQVPKQYLKPFGDLTGQRRTYAGMLAAMDEAVGQIVAALEEKKMLDNTFMLFSSDNGGPAPGKITSNGPLRAGKGSIYEGGIRVCACAAWPGKIPAGGKIDEPLHAVDWYPTLVKLAGGSLEQKLPLDGCDIAPVLTNAEKAPREALFLPGMSASQAAIRVGEWKLLSRASNPKVDEPPKSAQPKGVQLYNLRDDLGEQHDVATEHPEKVKELQAKLAGYLKDAVPFGAKGKD